jgi:hypothetical protein
MRLLCIEVRPAAVRFATVRATGVAAVVFATVRAPVLLKPAFATVGSDGVAATGVPHGERNGLAARAFATVRPTDAPVADLSP